MPSGQWDDGWGRSSAAWGSEAPRGWQRAEREWGGRQGSRRNPAGDGAPVWDEPGGAGAQVPRGAFPEGYGADVR